MAHTQSSGLQEYWKGPPLEDIPQGSQAAVLKQFMKDALGTWLYL